MHQSSQKLKNYYWYWFKLAILTAAVTLLTIQSWHEIHNWFIVIGFIIAGYFFGKLTCMRSISNYGLWLTLIVFVALNILHSTIDGIALVGQIHANYFPILAHEIVRQSALYFIIAESISPFMKSWLVKIPIAIVSVTGIWILGIFIGMSTGHAISGITWLDPFLPMTMFILVGDMIHHMMDEYQDFKNRA